MDVSKILDCNSVEEQDLVSQYVGQKLSPEEAEAFEEHYFGCDRCWAEVQAATEVRAALAPEVTAAKVTPFPASKTNWRLLAIAASVAIAVLAGLLVVRRGAGKTSVETVVAAAGSRRTTEARLTGGFPHAEVEAVTRGDRGPAKPWRLQKALEDAQRQVESKPSAEAWRAVGVAELLLGDDHDQAVNTLKKAAEKYPNDAQIQSDLAAAYFARFEALGQDTDLENSYEAAAQAVKIAPKLPEARFNKALILERLGHRSDAAKEWNQYLTLERDKGWAGEAEQHARKLSGRPISEMWPRDRERLRDAASRGDRKTVAEVVGRFPERCRQYVEDEVLPQWAETAEKDSTDLTSAREVAAIFRVEHGDSFLTDSLVMIDNALSAKQPGIELSRLAAAHRRYGEARTCYRDKSIEEAHRAYGEAEDLFESTGSPFRDLATVEGATCLFYENKSFPILEAVAPVIVRSKERYPQLLASAQWLKGLAELSLGHPSEALRAYSEALAAFQRVRDAENVASVHYLIGEVYQDLGEFEIAAEHRRQALTILTRTGELRRLYVAFHLTGIAAEEAKLPELARLAYAGAIRSARAAGNPDVVAHALIASAKAEDAFGNRELAATRLHEAKAVIRTIRESSLRDRASAELNIVVGQFEAPVDSGRSFRELDLAASFFEKKRDLGRIAQVRFERGKVYLAARNRPLATRDFMAAIAILESVRGEIAEDSPRMSYFENSQDLFDHAITTLAVDGQIESAADVVEQARARTLLDMVEAAVPNHAPDNLYKPALRGESLRRRLPLFTTLVEYVVLDDQLLIFTVQRSGVRLATIRVLSEKIDELTRSFLDSLGKRDVAPATLQSAANELHRLLISPIRGHLDGTQTVVFVPDKSLHRIPFAALRNPETGRYIVEDFQVGVSPSATIYVRSLDRYRVLAREPVKAILLVANPSFDRRLLPGLRTLAGAEREVRDVAALYPNPVILAAANATKGRFLTEAPAASLIHLASHALIERNPMFSKLVLAPEASDSDSGLLYAHEIPVLHLPRTRMVVLSACETLGGPEREGEGAISLARAFLASGVPVVLGTLVPVEDRTAAAMLSAFHRGLVRGQDPITALRNAQLALLGGADLDLRSPSSWAAFELIGGTAPPYKERGDHA
jgi:CHAT domain-containing protein/tetratricopeptide (TPR) repeat protein